MTATTATVLPVSAFTDKEVQVAQLGKQTEETVTPFVDLISRTSAGHDVRLYVSIPTWSPSSDTCLDLHDLNELRNRALKFIHATIKALRAIDICASYRLVPSNSTLCLVCALPPGLSTSRVQSTTTKLQTSALQAMKNAQMKRKDITVVADLQYPSLIIT